MRPILEYVARTPYVGGSPSAPAELPTKNGDAAFWALKSVWDDRVGDPTGPFVQREDSDTKESKAADAASAWLRKAPVEEMGPLATDLVAFSEWNEAGLASSFEPFYVLEGYCKHTSWTDETMWLWLMGVGATTDEIAEAWGVAGAEVYRACQEELDSLKGNRGWLVWYHNVRVDLIFNGGDAELAHKGEISPMALSNVQWSRISKEFVRENPAMVAIAKDTGAHGLQHPLWVAPPLVG